MFYDTSLSPCLSFSLSFFLPFSLSFFLSLSTLHGVCSNLALGSEKGKDSSVIDVAYHRKDWPWQSRVAVWLLQELAGNQGNCRWHSPRRGLEIGKEGTQEESGKLSWGRLISFFSHVCLSLCLSLCLSVFCLRQTYENGHTRRVKH